MSVRYDKMKINNPIKSVKSWFKSNNEKVKKTKPDSVYKINGERAEGFNLKKGK